MSVETATQLANAIKEGGGWFLFALALLVIGVLWTKNQALHQQMLDMKDKHNAATEAAWASHMATAKELYPLSTEMTRFLKRAEEDMRRLGEILAVLAKTTRPRSSSRGGGPASRGSEGASGGADGAERGEVRDPTKRGT